VIEHPNSLQGTIPIWHKKCGGKNYGFPQFFRQHNEEVSSVETPCVNSANELTSLNNLNKSASESEGKYLTFILAGKEYGIGILKVKEIIGMIPITMIPQTPEYMKGVINLRGKVIPVVDLRLKFEMAAMDYSERTCVIVVEIGTNADRLLTGIVVDSVSEVLNIKAVDIEKTSNWGNRMDTNYILGMAKAAGGIKILLDIERVLHAEELEAVNVAA
jgi:purine-binding chemotaxis protein CheW